MFAEKLTTSWRKCSVLCKTYSWQSEKILDALVYLKTADHKGTQSTKHEEIGLYMFFQYGLFVLFSSSRLLCSSA